MPDVSCRVFEFFTVNADTYGYGLDDLVRGAESPLEVFLDTSERVSWNDWAQISDNFCRLVGGLHETRIAGRTVPEMQFSAPMRSLGAALLTPADLYATTTRWLGPYLFRSLAWEVESLSPTHVVIRIAVRPGDRVSTAWFHLAQGAFEALPTVVGLSMAACQMDIDGGEVAFDLRCEAGQTWLSQLRSRARLATQPGVLLDQLADLQSDLRDAYARSVAAQEELRRALSAVPDPVAIVHADSPVWTNASWDRLIGETWPIPVTTTPGEHGSGDSRQIELPGSPPRVLEMPPRRRSATKAARRRCSSSAT